MTALPSDRTADDCTALAQIKRLLAQERARLLALAKKSDVPHAEARVANACREVEHQLGVMETAAGVIAPAPAEKPAGVHMPGFSVATGGDHG